jgi:threonine dehydrogenase-like Zn-dependent dehydrogenase
VRAVAAVSPGKVEVVDVPDPETTEYECLVRVRASGLCSSTDLKIIDGELSNFTVDFPVILGHEGVGEVVELGSAVKNISKGQLFTNPAGRLAAGTPYRPMWAGMAEYAVVQDHKVMEEMRVPPREFAARAARRVPGSIPPEDAAVILNLKENFSALGNFGFREGMEVLVFGDGPAGLGLLSFLRKGGAAWTGCVGHHESRLSKAREVAGVDLALNSKEDDLEAKLGGRRFDLVIDAVGSVDIIRMASHMLKPGGKVGSYGVLKKEHSRLSLLDLQNNTSVHMLNFPHREHAVHDEIVRMILEGQLHPKDYYSHVLPMEEAERAVRMVKSREAFKVILKM